MNLVANWIFQQAEEINHHVAIDKRGMVESMTRVMLVSNQDEGLNERLVIE